MEFRGSNIRKDTSCLLHLYNIITKFQEVNINFEKFFLTTDAPNMRRLNIHRCPRFPSLKNKDLLFISGFYNLEGIEIDGVIENYKQIDKLEKLREIKGLIVTSESELKLVEQDKRYHKFIENNVLSQKDIEVTKQNRRLYMQNSYANFRNQLYTPKIDSIKFLDIIKTNNIEKIKQELKNINNMTYQERKKIIKSEKKVPTLQETLFDLNFDIVEDSYNEYYLVNSRPFSTGGINYYRKDKKLIK